ncbi:hypothetical protein LIER_22054 [Lithospermum erythrorhizon]|uniref:RNase H type-1 domain-containing protein n=1 Tax=Lithospermum erythrorhizon TaxID=34254 RepID=A0AAV3QWM4_LITER
MSRTPPISQPFKMSRTPPIPQPVLSDPLARWYLQLQQFEIIYVPQRVVKGQVLADFLADQPLPAEWELCDELADEDVMNVEMTPPWKMYFDGAAHQGGAGAGVIFLTPQQDLLPYSFSLSHNCSNNVAEYQALILGLEPATDLDIHQLEIYGDSQLVINQLLGDYEVRKPGLIPYHGYAKRLLQSIDLVSIKHVPRKMNKQSDALVGVALSLTYLGAEIKVPVCEKWVLPPLFEAQEYEEGREERMAITTTSGATAD